MYHYQRQNRSETKVIHTCSESSSECITDLPFCRAGLLLSLRRIPFLWNCDLQAGLQAFWRQKSLADLEATQAWGALIPTSCGSWASL